MQRQEHSEDAEGRTRRWPGRVSSVLRACLRFIIYSFVAAFFLVLWSGQFPALLKQYVLPSERQLGELVNRQAWTAARNDLRVFPSLERIQANAPLAEEDLRSRQKGELLQRAVNHYDSLRSKLSNPSPDLELAAREAAGISVATRRFLGLEQAFGLLAGRAPFIDELVLPGGKLDSRLVIGGEEPLVGELPPIQFLRIIQQEISNDPSTRNQSVYSAVASLWVSAGVEGSIQRQNNERPDDLPADSAVGQSIRAIRTDKPETFNCVGYQKTSPMECLKAVTVSLRLTTLGHQLLYEAYMGKGSLRDGIEFYEDYLLQSPEDQGAMVNLGRFLLAQKEIDKAYQVAVRAVELDPDNPDALLLLGQASKFPGHFERTAFLDTVRRLGEVDGYTARGAEGRTETDALTEPFPLFEGILWFLGWALLAFPSANRLLAAALSRTDAFNELTRFSRPNTSVRGTEAAWPWSEALKVSGLRRLANRFGRMILETLLPRRASGRNVTLLFLPVALCLLIGVRPALGSTENILSPVGFWSFRALLLAVPALGFWSIAVAAKTYRPQISGWWDRRWPWNAGPWMRAIAFVVPTGITLLLLLLVGSTETGTVAAIQLTSLLGMDASALPPVADTFSYAVSFFYVLLTVSVVNMAWIRPAARGGGFGRAATVLTPHGPLPRLAVTLLAFSALFMILTQIAPVEFANWPRERYLIGAGVGLGALSVAALYLLVLQPMLSRKNEMQRHRAILV